MKKCSERESEMTVGMDLGDKYSQVCKVDAEGEVVEEARIRTTPDSMTKKFQQGQRIRVVIEAGTHSAWVSRELKECGHEVIVANPRKLRMIYANDSKDDKVDAEYLARIGRMDPRLLSPIQHRGKETQEELAVLRARDALVGARTQLINHVRGAVKAVGARVPSCSARSFHRKAAESIPEGLRRALGPGLQIIEELTQQIRKHDLQIEQTSEQKYPETKLLRQVSGVGPLTSLTYVLTIEDPGRFRKSRAVGAYVGLRPRQRKSGDGDPQLRITKSGDPMLRRLLVGSAHYMLGPFGRECDLRRWGMKIAKPGGKNAKKRAVVAVARKLAVLLHRLWVSREVYDPERQTRPAARKRKESVPA